MEQQQSTKIKFYVKRSFGEKLNVSFDFIKQNWKALLKFSTYMILPVCLVQAVSLNKFMGIYLGTGLMESIETDPSLLQTLGPTFLMHYLLLFLCIIIGNVLMTSTIYGLIQVYNEREDGLRNLSFQELKPYLLRNVGRCFVTMLMLFLLLALYAFFMGVLAAAAEYTLMLTFPLLMVLVIPLSLLMPVYLFERISIGKAIGKAFRLGMSTWGGVFGISLLMAIIANILSGVLSLPWSVVTMVKYFFSVSDVGVDFDGSTGFTIAQYLLGIFTTYGLYISMIFLFVGLAYQYAHANEKVNSVSVVDEIDNFEQF